MAEKEIIIDPRRSLYQSIAEDVLETAVTAALVAWIPWFGTGLGKKLLNVVIGPLLRPIATEIARFGFFQAINLQEYPKLDRYNEAIRKLKELDAKPIPPSEEEKKKTEKEADDAADDLIGWPK